MKFDKYEGLGNDFLVIDDAVMASAVQQHASRLCDRHRGVGADGILAILPPEQASHAARMRVINADGSIPETCGNGLRCVAIHLARGRGLEQVEFIVETDAGPRRCWVEDAGRSAKVSVDMGPVRWLKDMIVPLKDGEFPCSLVDAGNPHAVTFEPLSAAERHSFGPRVSEHPMFPRGINVGFASLTGEALDLVVWERGVGLTPACGTGACAAAVVAVEKRWLSEGRAIEVNLPGGSLQVIVHRADHRVIMRGPANHIFSGDVPL